MDEIQIRPLDRQDFEETIRLLGFLNPETPREVLAQRLHTLIEDHSHYRIFGAFSEGRLVGVSGAWIATKMWCGRYLEIDNLVVDPDCRSGGVGTRLIEHLVELGHTEGCRLVVLDSYTANHPSHRLYHRLGFEIWGFHFIKPIGDWVGNGGP